jgi:hypothetical protein
VFIILAVLILAAIGVGVVFLLPEITGGDGDDLVAAVPTPFPGAQTVTGPNDAFTISMLDEWVPQQSSSVDTSQGSTRLRNVWQADNDAAFIALTIFESPAQAADQMDRAMEAFLTSSYNEDLVRNLLIDRDVAEDGTTRMSFRIPGRTRDEVDRGIDRFAGPERDIRSMERPGQLDVFFRHEDGNLVVLEMYTADIIDNDTTGNDLVPRFQMILDSLRIG